MANRQRGKFERDTRRQAAELRADEREQRGDAGQLKRLEAAGHGYCKEANRMRDKLGKDK